MYIDLHSSNLFEVFENKSRATTLVPGAFRVQYFAGEFAAAVGCPRAPGSRGATLGGNIQSGLSRCELSHF